MCVPLVQVKGPAQCHIDLEMVNDLNLLVGAFFLSAVAG